MNKYPWLVRLAEVKKPEEGFCGGTLVASKYVITACHCTYEFNKWGTAVIGKFLPADLQLSIGDFRQDKFDETGREKTLTIKSIKRHPKYDKNQPVPGSVQNNGYDIAILELWEEVELTEYSPACLAKQTEGTRFNGKRAVAYGWGKIANPSVKWPRPRNPNYPSEIELKIDSSSCIDLAEKKPDAMIRQAQEPRTLCAGLDEAVETVQAGICSVSKYYCKNVSIYHLLKQKPIQHI